MNESAELSSCAISAASAWKKQPGPWISRLPRLVVSSVWPRPGFAANWRAIMNPERWKAVGETFEGALAVAASERQVWIEQASGGDQELRHEVSSLLASHDAAPGGFVQDRIKSVLASFNEAGRDPEHTTIRPYRLGPALGACGLGPRGVSAPTACRNCSTSEFANFSATIPHTRA